MGSESGRDFHREVLSGDIDTSRRPKTRPNVNRLDGDAGYPQHTLTASAVSFTEPDQMIVLKLPTVSCKIQTPYAQGDVSSLGLL